MPGLMITYVNGIPCSLTIVVSTITACSSAGLSSAGPGVAEPGGGPGGPCPPKNLSGWAKVCFAPPPPKFLPLAPPKWATSGQNLCQIASEHLEMSKISKIFRLQPIAKLLLYHQFKHKILKFSPAAGCINCSKYCLTGNTCLISHSLD